MWDWDEPTRRRRSIPKAVKDQVWFKYIGAGKAEGKCYVCGRTIHIVDFDVGHNRAKSKGGGDSIDNLRPICRTCNTSMGTQSIEVFKAKHFPTASSAPSRSGSRLSGTKTAAKKPVAKMRTKKATVKTTTASRGHRKA
ncbi:MAG: HNH endonuclease [Chloroflexi bacterium]|nr:HNH endonuclease [Chloroflexota bacterium]